MFINILEYENKQYNFFRKKKLELFIIKKKVTI